MVMSTSSIAQNDIIISLPKQPELLSKYPFLYNKLRTLPYYETQFETFTEKKIDANGNTSDEIMVRNFKESTYRVEYALEKGVKKITISRNKEVLYILTGNTLGFIADIPVKPDDEIFIIKEYN